MRIAIQHAGGEFLEIKTDKQIEIEKLEERVKKYGATHTLYDLVHSGLRKKGVSASRASREMGYAKGTLRSWFVKFRGMKSAPRKSSLEKIATYLDIDPDVFFHLAAKIKAENAEAKRKRGSQIHASELTQGTPSSKEIVKISPFGIFRKIFRSF